MWADRVRARLRGDDGFAMVTAVMVSSVMMLFTVGMLATGMHLTDATVRDRSWNTALQVAEAALDRAAYEVSKDPLYVGTSGVPMDLPGGQAEVLVDRPALGEIIVYATAWVPSRAATNAVSRRIQVTFGPEDVFSFALFSETGLYVKNNAVIEGDVFANEGVQIDNNAIVHGSAISATEGVELGSNAELRKVDGERGSAYSGGPAGIHLSNGAIVHGDAFAQATACSGTPGSDEYEIDAGGGQILGDAVAWGSITGVSGTSTPNNCQLAQATKTLPVFNWDPSLYEGELEYTTKAAFQSYVTANGGVVNGVHHVWVPECSSDPSGSDALDVGGITINTDLTLVTNCKLDMDNNVTVTAPDAALVNIIVVNDSTDPPAVLIKNNFDVDNDPAVLLYATGLIQVKNNPDHNGAVYAGAISIKNNLDVTYDPRVERTMGFGDVKYDRRSWVECRVSTTGTDC